jgi:alpha-methylacyl-CoA racemase
MGPLRGFKIVEIAGIGPGQYCGMLLADMGADVVRIVRPAAVGDDDGVAIPAQLNLMNRGRRTVTADLKEAAGRDLVLALCREADALFEGFRPGVMERLGLGPDDCTAVNPRLVYGRMTGWGQDGPLAGSAGHDGNYIALAGALHAIGEPDRAPALPLNLVGDFGGGGAFLAMGLLAALLEASRSGKGQIVDAAMVDGVASLMTLFHGLDAAGLWTDRRAGNLLDGGAPFYRSYRTADNKAVVVCALEPRFFGELLERLAITDIDPEEQYRRDLWPEHIERFSALFQSRDRDDWAAAFAGSDACVTPVLTLAEARSNAHLGARDTFVNVDGTVQPAPAPRFSRTPSAIAHAPGAAEEYPAAILADWRLDHGRKT